MIAGIGLNSVKIIPSSAVTGQMDVEALDKAVGEEIEKGNKPY